MNQTTMSKTENKVETFRSTLTEEERDCLKFWLRQAIAQLETVEVSQEFIRRHGLESPENKHRQTINRHKHPPTHHQQSARHKDPLAV